MDESLILYHNVTITKNENEEKESYVINVTVKVIFQKDFMKY